MKALACHFGVMGKHALGLVTCPGVKSSAAGEAMCNALCLVSSVRYKCFLLYTVPLIVSLWLLKYKI